MSGKSQPKNRFVMYSIKKLLNLANLLLFNWTSALRLYKSYNGCTISLNRKRKIPEQPKYTSSLPFYCTWQSKGKMVTVGYLDSGYWVNENEKKNKNAFTYSFGNSFIVFGSWHKFYDKRHSKYLHFLFFFSFQSKESPISNEDETTV